MFWSTMKADQCKAKQAICTLLVKNRQGLRLAIFQSWGIFASSSLVFPMRSGQIIGWLAALTSSLTHHRSRTENLPHLTGEQSPAEYLSMVPANLCAFLDGTATIRVLIGSHEEGFRLCENVLMNVDDRWRMHLIRFSDGLLWFFINGR